MVNLSSQSQSRRMGDLVKGAESALWTLAQAAPASWWKWDGQQDPSLLEDEATASCASGSGGRGSSGDEWFPARGRLG